MKAIYRHKRISKKYGTVEIVQFPKIDGYDGHKTYERWVYIDGKHYGHTIGKTSAIKKHNLKKWSKEFIDIIDGLTSRKDI